MKQKIAASQPDHPDGPESPPTSQTDQDTQPNQDTQPDQDTDHHRVQGQGQVAPTTPGYHWKSPGEHSYPAAVQRQTAGPNPRSSGACERVHSVSVWIVRGVDDGILCAPGPTSEVLLGDLHPTNEVCRGKLPTDSRHHRPATATSVNWATQSSKVPAFPTPTAWILPTYRPSICSSSSISSLLVRNPMLSYHADCPTTDLRLLNVLLRFGQGLRLCYD